MTPDEIIVHPRAPRQRRWRPPSQAALAPDTNAIVHFDGRPASFDALAGARRRGYESAPKPTTFVVRPPRGISKVAKPPLLMSTPKDAALRRPSPAGIKESDEATFPQETRFQFEQWPLQAFKTRRSDVPKQRC